MDWTTNRAKLGEGSRQILVGEWFAVWRRAPDVFGVTLWGPAQGALLELLRGLHAGQRIILDLRHVKEADAPMVISLATEVEDAACVAVVFGDQDVESMGENVQAFGEVAEAVRWMVGSAGTDVVALIEGLHAQVVAHPEPILQIRAALTDLGCGAELGEIAKAVGRSKRTLQRRLKARGVRFRDVVQRFRIEVAQRRLRRGAEPIGFIADELGYGSPQAFSTAFKAVVGATPSAWRSEHSSSQEPSKAGLHGFPPEHDSYVGRVDELARLAAMVADGGLITIHGPGGMGKSRLITHLARHGLPADVEVAWFADLSDCFDRGAVLRQVGQALGLELRRNPSEQIRATLAAVGRGLLVLDNVEQVSDSVSELLIGWSDIETTIVCTSRVRLNLRFEKVFPLEPLTPDEAADLFMDRAREVAPALELKRGAQLRALVEALDALPLAIELAASRVRAMDISEIASHLDRRFQLLHSANPDRPARHQTLRAAIEWSWTLLSPAERAAMWQLTVFEGGCDLEAASSVLKLSGDPWVPDVLAGLIDGALLQRSDGRYLLLESVSAFASEHSDNDQRADLEKRHGVWYALDWVVHDIDREAQNLLAAAKRAIGRSDGAVAVPAFERAWRVYERVGLVGAYGVGGALPTLDGLSAVDIVAAERLAGSTAVFDGRAELGLRHLERASEMAGQLDSPLESGRVSFELARLGFESNLAMATEELGRAFEASEMAGDVRTQARALVGMSVVSRRQGKHQRAKRYAAQALELASEAQDRRINIVSALILGSIAETEGDYERSLECYKRVGRICVEVRDRPNELAVLYALGRIHSSVGEVAVARDYLDRAALGARHLGQRDIEAEAMASAAALLWVEDQDCGVLAQFDMALDRAKRHLTVAVVRAFRGEVLMEIGEEERAEVDVDVAVSLATAAANDFVLVLALLLKLELRLRDPDESLDVIESLIHTVATRMSPDAGVRRRGRLDASVAWARFRQGDAAALESMDALVAEAAGSVGEHSPLVRALRRMKQSALAQRI